MQGSWGREYNFGGGYTRIFLTLGNWAPSGSLDHVGEGTFEAAEVVKSRDE